MGKQWSRKAPIVTLAPIAEDPPPSPPLPPDRRGRVAQRRYAGELRALVEGVEVVGKLPTARGATRHRLRILLSSGEPVQANLCQSADGDWITIERPGIAQDAADRLAEAALLRLAASGLLAHVRG